jgi:hypothetical protein
VVTIDSEASRRVVGRCLRSLGCDHKDLLVHGRIAEWHRTADPKAFSEAASYLKRLAEPPERSAYGALWWDQSL